MDSRGTGLIFSCKTRFFMLLYIHKQEKTVSSLLHFPYDADYRIFYFFYVIFLF